MIIMIIYEFIYFMNDFFEKIINLYDESQLNPGRLFYQ
jgi:hypothetical protein